MDHVIEATLQHLLSSSTDKFDELLDAHAVELEVIADDDFAPALHGIQTFDAAGLLTTDRGLVLRLSDGSEYQLSIVKRR